MRERNGDGRERKREKERSQEKKEDAERLGYSRTSTMLVVRSAAVAAKARNRGPSVKIIHIREGA